MIVMSKVRNITIIDSDTSELSFVLNGTIIKKH